MATGGVVITPDNRGPIINVISWISIILAGLATIAKVWSKWSLAQKFQADDYCLAAAMLTAVGWVAAVSKQVDAGLGRHITTMSPYEIIQYQQTMYASEFLYVASLCLAKMAILHFLLSLARVASRRRAVQCTMILNVITMALGIFAVAFQCPLPQSWTIFSSQCFNQTSFWIAFGAVDIVVDLATVVLPFILLHDLQTTWIRKLPAILAFALRSLIIPMIIIRLVFLQMSSGSTDHPFDDFDVTLTTAIHVNFSVIFTCLPFLKTVIDNMQTGLLAGDLRSPTQLHSYRYGGRNGSTNLPSPLTSAMRNRSHDNGSLVPNHGLPYQELWGGATIRESEERMVINRTTTISRHSDRAYSDRAYTSRV